MLQAQVLISENFKNATSSAFTLRNNAVLTASSAFSPTDAAGSGYLRLTSATANQRGAVISNAVFSATQGFNISFEFFAYASNTSGADGFSVFLIDGSTAVADFTTGAFGSSLGYAPATVSGTTTAGATNGYIGIGIDEYGGFNTSNEGRNGGGSAFVRNTVALRGNAAGGYTLLTPTLTASNTGSALGVSTTRAQSGNADYRRATINVTPTGGTFRVTVRIQNGTGVVTAINSFLLATAPPLTLRLGLAASTGGSSNVHEIRSLYVVVPPTAQDDNGVTPNNTPITLNILGNDNPANGSFDYSTIDLDPSTIAIDQSVTITGGTFAVNATTGTVTFTPSGTASVGSYSIPYVVSTVAGTGNNAVPATTTHPPPTPVQVGGTGADIATSVTGPATVQPGATITYTATTTNIGTASAGTVAPTLTLSQALVVSGALPAGATYANGVVTLPTTSTLAAGSSVTYTLTFVAPATASTVTATARGTTTSADANANNNNGSAANSVATTDVSRPLPVELASFQARATATAVQLAWRTASEHNNAWFDVERSADGLHFAPIARLKGQGTTTRSTDYAYTDETARQLTGSVLYYRLRQLDASGAASLSAVQAVSWGPRASTTGLRCYPNPVRENLTLDLTSWPASPCTIQLCDLSGRCQYTQLLTGGSYQTLALPALASGTYVLSVRNSERQQATLVVRE